MRNLLLTGTLVLSSLASLALQDPAPAAPAPDTGPHVGAPAPAFRLNDHEGHAVAIGGATDHWTVLAFYPKAATPG